MDYQTLNYQNCGGSSGLGGLSNALSSSATSMWVPAYAHEVKIRTVKNGFIVWIGNDEYVFNEHVELGKFIANHFKDKAKSNGAR